MPVFYKNLKMLPYEGWEVVLEGLGVVDELIMQMNRGNTTHTDQIWRATHWRMLLYVIYDWYKMRHSTLMSGWGRMTRGKIMMVVMCFIFTDN